MNNPFVDRYAGLSVRHYIQDRTIVRPDPIVCLDECNVNTAALRLEHRLKEIFLPNKFAFDFICEVIENSAWYCSQKYPDEISYNKSIFHPASDEVIPACLTGLAGVGKTALISALLKVLPGPVEYRSGILDTKIDIISYWVTTGRDKGTPKQILYDMIQSASKEPINRALKVHQLMVMARSFSGKYGLPLIIMDEMQHVTLSSATAMITSQILTFAKLGVPLLYVSNYSLQNSLFDRNAEDTQRLTANPRILEPDEPESDDWKAYVHECVRVMGPYIAVKAENLTSELHVMTFGLKRYVVRLLRISYTEARRKGRSSIDFADVESAYASAEYTSARTEVLVLKRQLIEGGCVRRDLWCPYVSPVKKSSAASEFYVRDNSVQLAKAAIKSSMTPSERAALHELSGLTRDLETELKKPRASKKRVSYDDLLEGHKRSANSGRSNGDTRAESIEHDDA